MKTVKPKTGNKDTDEVNAAMQLVAIAKLIGFDATTTEPTPTGCKDLTGGVGYFAWHGILAGVPWKLEALIRGLIAKADKYADLLHELAEDDIPDPHTCWGEELYDRFRDLLDSDVDHPEEVDHKVSSDERAAFNEALDSEDIPNDMVPWEENLYAKLANPEVVVSADPEPTGDLWEDW